MSYFFPLFHFSRPLYLLLLALMPLLWLKLRSRSFVVVLWRSVVLALLVLALADPQRASDVGAKGERVFAFDLSRSIPEEMRQWMAQQAPRPAPGDRVFVFGGEAREVKDWDRWLRGEESAAAVKPERTNLAGLLSALLDLPPARRSLFLFTDGWETQGDAQRLLPSLALSGIKVFPMLPPGPPAAENVAVKKILAPHEGTSGEAAVLQVMVENQNRRPVEGRLVLRRNGEPWKSEEIKVPPGNHLFTYQAALPAESMVGFQAEFIPARPDSDRFPGDNRAAAWVTVRSRAKVLLLNGRSGEGKYLEEILKRRGYEVTSATPGPTPPSPAGYSVVVFNNVAKEKFSAAYLAGIERHVAEGNAFLMLGAEGSFAPGGYRHTPIATILPVELQEPKKEEKNRAVVLVIDKSGSMREQNKLVYAKAAAKAVATQLKDDDLLGVMGFDSEPFVVVPLSPIQRIRATVGGEIDRLKAQGKTYLYPAMIEAKRQLERQSAGRKYMIILTDGETGGSGSDYIDLVTVMKEEKITVSTVAIGDEVNIPLLKRIAQYGGGFFHHTYDPTTLPRIVVEQIGERPEKEGATEKSFLPVLVRGSELLSGFAEKSYPRLTGYVEAAIKPRARQDLIIPQGGEKKPLLASWSYGKGKAAAFTADLDGRWSAAWIRWPELERFWSKVFDWLRPIQETLPPHEVRIDSAGNRVVLDLYLYAEGHEEGRFHYSFKGRQGSGEGILEPLAPGHYQAALPLSLPGDYRIEISEELQGRRLSYPIVGYTLSSDPKDEVPHDGFNIPLLEEIANSTGGEINPADRRALAGEEEIARHFKPLRPYLLAAALALFLAEIFLRKFFLPLAF